jgi:hypothetical protein
VTERTDPGPLAEEAARLVEAGLEWARRAATAVDPTGERIATGAPECGVCPVCRTVSALRDPSPEVAERLTGVVTDLASLVAAGLRAFETHQGAGQSNTHAGAPPQPEGRAGVEHIDIA